MLLQSRSRLCLAVATASLHPSSSHLLPDPPPHLLLSRNQEHDIKQTFKGTKSIKAGFSIGGRLSDLARWQGPMNVRVRTQAYGLRPGPRERIPKLSESLRVDTGGAKDRAAGKMCVRVAQSERPRRPSDGTTDPPALAAVPRAVRTPSHSLGCYSTHSCGSHLPT